MRNLKNLTLSFIIAIIATSGLIAQIDQIDSSAVRPSKYSVVVKNDGTEYMGVILKQDAREVLIDTKNLGEIIIPKHEIREIKELGDKSISSTGNYIPSEVFSTRYFITTNALPIDKGESYAQWNLYGPDFQWGIGKNLGVGVMTSWLGVPIIGSVKYSFKFTERVRGGVGTLLGTGSYAAPELLIALPFGVLTIGDNRNNINFSAGYGAVWYDGDAGSNMLISVAGMTKINKTVSLVFDSFIIPSPVAESSSGLFLFIPGIRLQTESNKAFQFGFAGVYTDSELLPLPIPMVQWYRRFN